MCVCVYVCECARVIKNKNGEARKTAGKKADYIEPNFPLNTSNIFCTKQIGFCFRLENRAFLDTNLSRYVLNKLYDGRIIFFFFF